MMKKTGGRKSCWTVPLRILPNIKETVVAILLLDVILCLAVKEKSVKNRKKCGHESYSAPVEKFPSYFHV